MAFGCFLMTQFSPMKFGHMGL